MKSQRSKKSIHKAVTQAAKSFDLYTDNHRMVPRQITPAVIKMEMTVGKFVGQRCVAVIRSVSESAGDHFVYPYVSTYLYVKPADRQTDRQSVRQADAVIQH